ncbi:cobaltochelatase subunit CobN [Enterovirga rhinocerotis]|uniref:Cobaltochelatase CobN subunit n=1 Tax=Enterovirga rhinocerotis TaxID=1339210 RepID=A0A4R7C7G4_9HYPH|nr:cobaltochelatase subunit CobN [Enterovirga rhinocerotis]TDR94574.1 cobaltochelatase CobN subunit [Enterovirga rhinocerotis]
MHIQFAPAEGLDDGSAARDLNQDPAEIVILSAADTELAALGRAAEQQPEGAPSVALTNFLALRHPLSVDLYVERTLAQARVVVLRLLGGESYWPYGIEQLRRAALQRGMSLYCVPGDTRWDADFAARGTAGEAETRVLWRYLAEGGAENVAGALAFLAHALGRGEAPPPPRPVPSAGLWPSVVPPDGRPRAAILFYRALVQGGMTEPIEALRDALEDRGIAAQPIYVTSLKDEASAALVATTFAAAPPDIILNATAFAVGVAGLTLPPRSGGEGEPERSGGPGWGVSTRRLDCREGGQPPHPARPSAESALPSASGGRVGAGRPAFSLPNADCPVLQVSLASTSEAAWRASPRGLTPRDLAIHVVLPEVDGRIFAGAVAFKEGEAGGPVVSRSVPDRIAAAADLAAAWVRLRRAAPGDRRVALVLANYPNRDGRLANGVGLDTPESTAMLLAALREEGYRLDAAPETSADLMALLTSGPTNDLARRRSGRIGRGAGVRWPLDAYRAAYAMLPEETRAAVEARWGEPEDDPHVEAGAFRLGLHRFGHVVIGIQPARGYNIDPKETYHAPDLAPPHHYLAFYLWLRRGFDAHAAVHLGKHGNLEWLPGKSAGLTAACFPQALLGPLPNLYPFIVNDPGEGMQAKRRIAAVVVDHLTPPLARAELHGDLSRLEALVDEYATAADLDPKRADALTSDILAFSSTMRLDADLDLASDTSPDETLRRIDAHLCDLKEMQIRDGLHILGRAPEAGALDALLVAIARLPRSDLRPEDASLHRALAEDLGLGFDPLTRDLAAAYAGPKPEVLTRVGARSCSHHPHAEVAAAGGPRSTHTRSASFEASLREAPQDEGRASARSDPPWRIAGDTVERIEALAEALVCGRATPDPAWTRTLPVLRWIAEELRPAIAASGEAEIGACLAGLDGHFVPPGPSGAPTRGRPDVLPTGRNFFAVDSRAVPTEAAWRTGRAAAEELVLRYVQEEGDWPRAIALSLWGTANMRTGGDDVAQALALLGARPVWEPGSGRVTGFRIMDLMELKRPRVDVTLRVSGLFRDAFPVQMDLVDSAVRAIAALDEPDDQNPLAARVRAESEAAGGSEEARRRASTRIFGSMPGAYGAGLQAPIDEGGWQSRDDLAGAYLAWSGFAYGGGREGEADDAGFRDRLAGIDAVVQAQDNREHDILDSDDYYQFMGGLAAAVETVSGRAPPVFHLDTSRPEAPLARTLSEEIARVVRGRAANPKWIAGVMRHGYKGAFEIAGTVDYLFGFAATTDAVKSHHFDQLFAAYLEDEAVRSFMEEANPAALRETAARFEEALRRGLWQPRSNRAGALLAGLTSDAA